MHFSFQTDRCGQIVQAQIYIVDCILITDFTITDYSIVKPLCWNLR